MEQTVKAYMSTDGAFTLAHPLRMQNGRGGPLTQAESAAKALAELARILADVEPETERSYYGGEPFGGHQNDGTLGATAAILAESLAAITADGGPLDQLAAQALDGALYSMERWSVLLDVHRQNMTAHRNAADPIIAAAQRDLGVLRAYAAQVGGVQC